MTRTGADAIHAAEASVGTNVMPDSGLCLAFVRGNVFDVPAYYGSAVDAWHGATDRHPGDRNPPPAVPVWFDSASPYEHVAFHSGDGRYITTYNDDVRAYSLADMEAIYGPAVGWAPSINTVTIYTEQEDDMTPDEVQSACQEAIKNVLRAPEFQGYMIDLPWAHIISGPASDGSGTTWTDRTDAWLRDARLAPQLTAEVRHVSTQVDELTASAGVRSWPSTLALILAVAIIAGLVAALVGKAVDDGIWAGAATLLGGVIGWAATTVSGRMRHR